MRQFYLLVVLISYAGGSEAQIYRWIDENGTTHFSDSPPPGDSAEEVELRDQPSEQAVQEAQEDLARRLQYQRADSEERRETQAAQEQGREEAERQEAERQVQCANARQQLEVLEMQLPVYRENDAGEREYLDDNGRLAEQTQLRRDIAQHCN